MVSNHSFHVLLFPIYFAFDFVAPIDEGTRVPYVFALPNGGSRGRKNLKETVTDDAEDVQYMLQHNIRPNRSYYLVGMIFCI